MQALDGKQGPAFDSLVYGAAMALWQTGLVKDKLQAANHVRDIIQSGKAKACFEQGVG
jgi:anthranilate phosphoribosyltransferase